MRFLLLQAELDLVMQRSAAWQAPHFRAGGRPSSSGTHDSKDEALAELTRRYFSSHGPATLRDFIWWSSLTAAQARHGLELLKGKGLRRLKAGGRTHWMPEAPARRATDETPVHLLQAFDECIVGYTESRSVLAIAGQPDAPSGAPMHSNVLIRDGQVIGSWRTVLDPEEALVDVHLMLAAIEQRDERTVSTMTEVTCRSRTCVCDQREHEIARGARKTPGRDARSGVGDIDFVAQTLTVRRATWRGVTGSPKSGRDRKVPLSARLAATLRAHRHLRWDWSSARRTASVSRAQRSRRRSGTPTSSPGSARSAPMSSGTRSARTSRCRVQRRRPCRSAWVHSTLPMTLRYMHLAPRALPEAIALLDCGQQVEQREERGGLKSRHRIRKLSGEGGIRTRGELSPTRHFQCRTFGRSVTSPI
jgi:hypothetical protein